VVGRDTHESSTSGGAWRIARVALSGNWCSARGWTRRRGLEIAWSLTGEHDPCPCDPALVRPFEQAAADQGIAAMVIPSGAAHDLRQLALIAPVAMIFVQSLDGRSHTPVGFRSVEHAVAGIEVLAEGLHRLAW
jgi:allantoate deiminase